MGVALAGLHHEALFCYPTVHGVNPYRLSIEFQREGQKYSENVGGRHCV